MLTEAFAVQFEITPFTNLEKQTLSQGYPGNFAGMSWSPEVAQKAREVCAHFLAPITNSICWGAAT